MKWPADLGSTLRDAAARARDEARRIRAEADRLRSRVRGDAPTGGALAAFVRPDLGATPAPLRRVLEPLVAAAAAVALALLLGIGVFNFAMFFAAATLIYAILTYVFGIEFDLNLPT